MPFYGTELGTFENHPLAKLGAVVSSASDGTKTRQRLARFVKSPDDAGVLQAEAGTNRGRWGRTWHFGCQLQLEDRDDYVR